MLVRQFYDRDHRNESAMSRLHTGHFRRAQREEDLYLSGDYCLNIVGPQVRDLDLDEEYPAELTSSRNSNLGAEIFPSVTWLTYLQGPLGQYGSAPRWEKIAARPKGRLS